MESNAPEQKKSSLFRRPTYGAGALNTVQSDQMINPTFNYDIVVQKPMGQLNRYSIFVLLVCELGIVSICGSMLAPIYHKVKPSWTCDDYTDGGEPKPKDDCSCSNKSYLRSEGFYTFAQNFHLVCGKYYLTSVLASLIMVGGLFGAITFGMFSDRFGRKVGGITSLTGNIIATFVIMFSPSYPVACVFSTIAGFFGAGYMVTAIVTVIEFVGIRYRMLVSCFHGWPYGLMYMGLIGFITKDWRYYQLAVAVTGIPFVVLWCLMVESPRWLIRMKKLDEAEKALAKMQKFNGRKGSPVSFAQLEQLYEVECLSRAKTKGYTYFDLFRYPIIRKNICVMIYLWFTSAIISWAIYTNVGRLAGVIYLNVFLQGVGKAIAGLCPLILSCCMGRRPIMLIGIAFTMLAMWGIGGIYIHTGQVGGTLGYVATGFAILGVASLDITWKINHLYANELFPTVVRNMAGGACNVGARIASIIGPHLGDLQDYYIAAPYILFGILVVGQFIVVVILLPETKGKPMPDSLPPKASEMPLPNLNVATASADENNGQLRTVL